MIVRWDGGREHIDRLLSEQRLQRVTASRELADVMLAQADAHLSSARLLVGSDTAGGFQLAYDAARKALGALLANQGLRASGNGAHTTLYDVARAQLHPPLGPKLEAFDWMRRLRNTTEYPDLDKPMADDLDLEEAIPSAEVIIAVVRTVIDSMPVY